MWSKSCGNVAICVAKNVYKNPQHDHLITQGIGNKLIERIKETSFLIKEAECF
jgi:hypothetical protein